MSDPVTIRIEAIISQAEGPALIAAGQQLSTCLGSVIKQMWPVQLGLRGGVEDIQAAEPGTVIVASLLTDAERIAEPWAIAELRWRERVRALVALGPPLVICTIFRVVPDRARLSPRGAAPPLLERIRRLNRLAAELSRETACYVADIDRAMAHVGGRVLNADYRLASQRAAEAAGHAIVWSLLSGPLDDAVSPEILRKGAGVPGRPGGDRGPSPAPAGPDMSDAGAPDPIALLRRMMLIRAFETALMRRPDHGFQLLSSGQEAVSVGLCAALSAEDQLLCSGRAIAPALARGLSPGEVMAELLGKSAGPARGHAGRGHMAKPAAGFFGAHAVVAGNLSIAAGVALALQTRGERGVVACLFGDGACGAGVLHETLNIAALWKLPLVLVCDNNQLSISTGRFDALAPVLLSDIAKPFGIPSLTVDGMDALTVREAAAGFVERARGGEGPSFLECVSYRFSPHSTATRETRPERSMKLIQQFCPIRALSLRLIADGAVGEAAIATLQADVDGEVAAAEAFAEASPYPDPAEAFTHVG